MIAAGINTVSRGASTYLRKPLITTKCEVILPGSVRTCHSLPTPHYFYWPVTMMGLPHWLVGMCRSHKAYEKVIKTWISHLRMGNLAVKPSEVLM